MFDEIEARRIELNVDQKELCSKAGVHETTYGRIKKNVSGGTIGTIKKLKKALDALEKERAHG